MRDADKQMLADHYLDLYQMAFSILKSEMDAEDAVQDALVETMTRQVRGDPYKYCVVVLRNICKRMMRSIEVLPDTIVDVPNPDTDIYNRRLHRLLDLIEKLPNRVRDIICLYYKNGYTKAEIAKQKGISESTVKKRLKKGQDLLREQLIEIELNDKDIFKP